MDIIISGHFRKLFLCRRSSNAQDEYGTQHGHHKYKIL